RLRVLHRDSFVDDPTRAIRAARYAARFGLAPEEETLRLLRETKLDTVSVERRDAELMRLAAEPTAPDGFALLAEWGLLELREGGAGLAAAAAELLGGKPWRGFASLDRTQMRAAMGPTGGELRLSEARPARPSEAVALAKGRDPVELVLARAMGATWLDDYVAEWRKVALQIDGEDLIAAGLEQGPALGRGLEAALRLKLDGELEGGRERELAAALAAARGDDGVA
ncbi:MAG TPA: hypothetical protein VG816_15285, partial [Solirubrobacterales bacterium]|nr:hypothetical protein [Solirubrobacterales bacterium]